MMKEQTKIPISKVQRATKFAKTGFRVGGNYLKHYTKKAFDMESPREELHEANATEVYGSLSELKGSALKVAQMMAMDKNMLPKAYQNKFTLAQYSAPPLSYPLVVQTFRKAFGMTPDQIYDEFSSSAVNAASIGQVHKARLGGRTFAVKVQYPGVSASIDSDLKMVKPFATRLFNISQKDLDHYMGEVREKLMEETDYLLEVRRSMHISESCSALEGIEFPRYYPDLSAGRIITMDWMDGKHLHEFVKGDIPKNEANLIGQRLWDFYQFQMHKLKMVHADPHPGNFLIKEGGVLAVIDFGCVKEIPEDFYELYFQLMAPNNLTREEKMPLYEEMQFIYPDDSQKEREYYYGVFSRVLDLIRRPLGADQFDFGDPAYFRELYDLGFELSQAEELRKSKHGRGSRHTLYLNRTIFGLYNLLHELGATIHTKLDEYR